MNPVNLAYPQLRFQGTAIGLGSHSGIGATDLVQERHSLNARQASLEKTLSDLGPTKINIPHSKLPSYETVPESVKEDYNRVLKDVSPTDLTSFAKRDLMGILEELADVTHAAVQYLAMQTGTLKHSDFEAFNKQAQPLTVAPKKRFAYLQGLTQKFVQNIPWDRPKNFLEFTRINGTDKDQPNYDAETSLTKQQLSDFLSNAFISAKMRRTVNWAPGFSEPKEFLIDEQRELKENVTRWVNNPQHTKHREAALSATKNLDTAIATFIKEASPSNARGVFKGVGDLGKILIGVDALPTRTLFDYILTKARGRMSGSFLENLENLHGKAGYDSAKKVMKPLEALVEAASLKTIFALNRKPLPSDTPFTQVA